MECSKIFIFNFKIKENLMKIKIVFYHVCFMDFHFTTQVQVKRKPKCGIIPQFITHQRLRLSNVMSKLE